MKPVESDNRTNRNICPNSDFADGSTIDLPLHGDLKCSEFDKQAILGIRGPTVEIAPGAKAIVRTEKRRHERGRHMTLETGQMSDDQLIGLPAVVR